MLENFVLFHFRGSPWTLGGLCIALTVGFFVLFVALLPYMASRYGTVKRMSTEEAQRRVFIGTDSTYLTGKVVAGPAAGKKWEVGFTIGGLRNMRVHGEYGLWLLLPAYISLFFLSLCFLGIGLMLLTGDWIFLLFSGGTLLLLLVVAFMMWASIYTQLE